MLSSNAIRHSRRSSRFGMISFRRRFGMISFWRRTTWMPLVQLLPRWPSTPTACLRRIHSPRCRLAMVMAATTKATRTTITVITATIVAVVVATPAPPTTTTRALLRDRRSSIPSKGTLLCTPTRCPPTSSVHRLYGHAQPLRAPGVRTRATATVPIGRSCPITGLGTLERR
jgi:hypothetical protein